MSRGHGGRGRNGRSGPGSNVSIIPCTGGALLGRRVTDRHDFLEYNELISYVPDMILENASDLKYYEDCKNDLRLTLLVNKSGVRVRDIRSQFRNVANYNIDLDRLRLKSWVHFLLSCARIVDFRLDCHPDEDKEQLFAFVSDYGKREIHQTTRDMQSMINCTPDDRSSPRKLVSMTAREAFVKGFLDAADGTPRVDPRVPIQDLGVAAAETMRKIRTQKLSFDEQIALTNKQNKPTMTVETTGPIPETQTSSVGSVFAWMDQLQEISGANGGAGYNPFS